MRKLLAWVLGTLALVGALIAVAARGPDFEVPFEREVPTELAEAAISSQLLRVRNWPAWHFDGRSARLEREGGAPELQAGDKVWLAIEPRKQPWRRFEFGLRLVEVGPGPRIRVKLEDDPKGKVTALLSGLEWTIEALPSQDGSRRFIRARLSGATRSARARFFARISPRTLMNQVFRADLLALAGHVQVGGLELSPR